MAIRDRCRAGEKRNIKVCRFVLRSVLSLLFRILLFSRKWKELMMISVRTTDNKIPPKKYPTLEGIKNILESLTETDPKAKAAKPEDFVDMSFIKELDKSGFVDDLYKGRKR